MHQRNERFQRSIPDVVLTSASAVVGFDTAAWLLIERCARGHIPLILDQSIAHPDAKTSIYESVREQYPGWGEGIEARQSVVRGAEETEHRGARAIVVASSFTKQTMIDHGVCSAKIRVNPYGVDCEQFKVGERRRGPLRFLFVGMINARKGVPLLLDAWERIGGGGSELWLIGHASAAVRALLPKRADVKYLGAVPHDEVATYMQQADVFVFPSYFEGFGLVLLEAMACGLPVITTTATAGPDLVTEGEDGWIIERGDLNALTEAIAHCQDHPDLVRQMRGGARITAESFSWSAYGDRWIGILREFGIPSNTIN
jgi:glycosyltransferase involved in cell wall biosynthesis